MFDNPDIVSASRYGVIASLARGREHVRRAAPCQDAAAYGFPVGGGVVAAVADGAGSASMGEVGATRAVTTAVITLMMVMQRAQEWPSDEEAWQRMAREVLAQARANVEDAARTYEVEPRALASTLILCIARPELVAAAQIGDGAAVLCQQAEDTQALSLSLLTKPQKGQYSNETVFLTSQGAVEQAECCLWQGKALGFALCTDGIEHMAINLQEGKPRPSFLGPLFRFARRIEDVEEGARQLNGFLRSEKIMTRTHDDVTLLLATVND